MSGYLYPPGDAKALASRYCPVCTGRHVADEPRRSGEDPRRGHDEREVEYSYALYESLQVVAAGRGEPKAESIRFLDDWLDQHRHAERVVRAPRQRSLRHRLRRIARHNYYRARKVRAALSGK